MELEHAPELELARLARTGDEPAFAEIVRRFSPRVFHVARRFFRQADRFGRPARALAQDPRQHLRLLQAVAPRGALDLFGHLVILSASPMIGAWLGSLGHDFLLCSNGLGRAWRHEESSRITNSLDLGVSLPPSCTII